MSMKITGTGMYVPERTVTNDELSDYVETSDEWIRQRVGVAERRLSTSETAAELGINAAKAALENAHCTAADLDLIIAATVSGEDIAPSVSCSIQNALGADCMAFDINAACSAFIFMLETAAAYISHGFRRVLVVGAERLSRIVDWTDRSTCVIFGDGAGAAVLESGENYLASTFTVKGGDSVIKIAAPRGNSPFFKPENEAVTPYIHMNGQETFRYAVNAICSDVKKLLDRAGKTIADVAYIVPHQANSRIIDFAAQRLGIPPEKFYQNISRYGNTSSASIPMALDEMSKKGLLKRGDLLLMCAFGGGLANAACLIEW